MNIPTYQKKDYSYLPNAFQQASQGFGQVTQGISQAMDIGDRERKRAREEELLADLKIQRKDAEKVRETAIVELASEIREAMGLPDDEKGYNRALDMSMQYYHPFFGNEKQDPGVGVKRLYDQEQSKAAFLNKIKMNRFREEFNKGAIEEPVPRTTTIQEPVGTVGVEDQGIVKKPLETTPQSLPQLQQQVARDSITDQAAPLKTISRERTTDDFYRLGVDLGITELPEFKGLMSTLSRQDIMKKERETPITQQQYAKEALAEPVVPTNELVGKLPSEMSEAERERLKIAKMAAQRPRAGTDQTSKDIREETKRYDNTASEILKYTEKINRLRQLRVKLAAGKKLDEKMMQALTGIVTNPQNPDISEIDREIDKLDTYKEGLREIQEEAKNRITQLGKGKPLAEVVTGEDEKKQAVINQSVEYIRNKISPVTSGFTTTAQIINMLPAMFKTPMNEKVSEMRGRGMSDKEIADRLLGR